MRTTQQLHEWVLKEMQTYTAMEQVHRLGGDPLIAKYYEGRREALKDVASHLVIYYKCAAVPEAAVKIVVETNAAPGEISIKENGGDV